MSKIRNFNKKIESKVVGTYKKIENTTVSGYKKIEDKFVDMFLRNDEETIEQAKIRVKKEQQELEEKNRKRIEEQMTKSKNIICKANIYSELMKGGENNE